MAKKNESMTADERENTKKWARFKEDKGDNLNNIDHAAVQSMSDMNLKDKSDVFHGVVKEAE